jgi:hypothetical protein
MLGTMIVPANAGEFWTLVTALATIAIAVLAVRGLRSIALARADIVTRATKEARHCAIARCEEFASKIIPANQEILLAMTSAQIPVFVTHPNEVRFDPDNEADLPRAREWISKVPYELQAKMTDQLNRVEAWATYFTAQLADESVAFGPCAPYYCSMIAHHYALLLQYRTASTSGKFPNALTVYKAWIAKLEHEQRGLQADALRRQLADLQAKHPPRDLPGPLGTHLDV